MLGVMRDEDIYERNGDNENRFYRKAAINSSYAAMRSRDVYTKHPSQKPIQLLRMLIENFTELNDIVFDPFMGSGTTGVACVQTGRNFIGIEIEPKYYEIAEKRIAEAQLQIRMPI
jgi:DNA modification methylase